MMNGSNKINNMEYTKLISHLPLISMDFIIINEKNEVLLGLRKNAPASNFWFVPGGRIKRMENFNHACERITLTEFGRIINIKDTSIFGVFEHMYDDSSYSEKVGVHYISLGIKVNGMQIKLDDLPNAQHREYRWFEINDLKNSKNVHERTKDFFNDKIGLRV